MADLLSALNSLRLPARVCAVPTDLGIAFPHGGTDLGEVANIAALPRMRFLEITQEARGGEVTEAVGGGEAPVVGMNLRGFNNEMISRTMRETFVGGSGTRGIRYKTTQGGDLRTSDAFKLLISPRDTAKHPGLILYAAAAVYDQVAEIPFGTDRETGVRMLFLCFRDNTNGIYELQKLAEMTL